MKELTRHAPLGRTRRRPPRVQSAGLPHHYAVRKSRHIHDLYLTDRAEARHGGRFRWFFSTCLAGGIGALVIAAVVLGSMDQLDVVSAMPELRPQISSAQPILAPPVQDGLKWATAKHDKLQTAAGAMLAKYVVQETVKQQRGKRDYLHHKFYARIAIRLAAVPAKAAHSVPPFNPVKLYGGTGTTDGADTEIAPTRGDTGDVAIRFVELLGSILPSEDGQEMETQEVTDLVSRTSGASEAAIRPTFVPEGVELSMGKARPKDRARSASIPLASNTSNLEKTTHDADDIADEGEGKQVKFKIGRGETLGKILSRMGADPWQSREMSEKARSILPDSQIVAGMDLELTLVPSLADAAKSEPARLSIYSGTEHKVTVRRTAAGEFIAQATPPEAPQIHAAASGEDQGSSASLYASFYHAATVQGLPVEVIQQILKIHAYETDYRRRARGSDEVDLFFDLRDEGKAADNPPAELLSTAMVVGGEAQRYFRFRTSDGIIDFYDENGNNSRKFLMRKPIRSDDVRFMSGYGMRRHPLLGIVRMHSGVDWAGPMGTPILAAGAGIIEEAGFKGQSGNYIRIRHANGYQTAYSHMQSRFPPDIREGTKVRQGQTIGYLGNSGLSTGPHLHFEILVSNRFVDPMSIQVPKERRLTGKALADFQRERARIEDLMRRPPVRVAQIEGR